MRNQGLKIFRKRSHTLDEGGGVDDGIDDEPPTDPIAEDLNLAEKATQLLQARSMPMHEWKHSHIQVGGRHGRVG